MYFANIRSPLRCFLVETVDESLESNKKSVIGLKIITSYYLSQDVMPI